MSAQRNKETFVKAFEAVNRGDSSLFVDSCAENVVWRTIGDTKFSGTYSGKKVMVEKFLTPFFADLNPPKIEFFFDKIFADGNFLCCQCRGDAVTVLGKRYQNEYAYILTFNDEGKIVEFLEFNNSVLVNEAFGR